jgi:hypothetical protein
MSRADHSLLIKSLADFLHRTGWLAFTEIEIRGTGGRVDVAAVKPHYYARKDLRAYEVKATRSDFLSDAGQNKWKRYLSVFHRVYFAAPQGLIKSGEVPEGAGLIVFSGKGSWQVLKAARGHIPKELDADAVLSLLFRGYYENREMRRLTARIVAEENLPLERKAKNIGWDIARRLAGGKHKGEHDFYKLVVKFTALCESAIGRKLDFDTYSDQVEIEKILDFAANLTKYHDAIVSIGKFIGNLPYYDPELVGKRAAEAMRHVKKVPKEG